MSLVFAFANSILGREITADLLTDDGLGRTLDWLSAHDPTTLFAGIARRARQVFDVSTAHVHVETTSCSVRRDDAAKQTQTAEAQGTATEAEADPALIALTSGSSRDHREDLTPWMLARATTHEGERPLCVPPLSGNSRDKGRVLAAIQEHVRATDDVPRVSVADHGVSSEATRRWVKQATLTGISRVSETSTQAKQELAESLETGQTTEDGSMHVDCRILNRPQGQERGHKRNGRKNAGTWAISGLPVRPMRVLLEIAITRAHPPGWTCKRAWWPMRTTKAEGGPATRSARSPSRSRSWPA
jgi:transposase-like protein